MKAVWIAACILAVEVFWISSAESNLTQQFKNIYKECAEQSNRPYETSVNILTCTLINLKIMQDDNGEYSIDIVDKKLEQLISDKQMLKVAKAILANCDDFVTQRGALGIVEKTFDIIQCTMPILNLVDGMDAVLTTNNVTK